MPPASVQSILLKHGIRAKKALGQHFLAAVPTIRKIIAALDPQPHENIIEIGPGPGVMTALTAEHGCHILAVDTDRDMIAIAQEELREQEHVAFLHGDILKQSIEDMRTAFPSHAGRIKILGNLPYNISSPILFWMLDQRELISQAVIMVQKEVALRIAAKPGNKDYGILSVITQCFAHVERRFDVSAASFIPPPEVTSSVLRLDFTRPHAPLPQDEAFFRDLVRSAFGKRRKTIRNALLGATKRHLAASTLDDGFAAIQIDPRRRPETISVSEYVQLADFISSH